GSVAGLLAFAGKLMPVFYGNGTGVVGVLQVVLRGLFHLLNTGLFAATGKGTDTGAGLHRDKTGRGFERLEVNTVMNAAIAGRGAVVDVGKLADDGKLVFRHSTDGIQRPGQMPQPTGDAGGNLVENAAVVLLLKLLPVLDAQQHIAASATPRLRTAQAIL